MTQIDSKNSLKTDLNMQKVNFKDIFTTIFILLFYNWNQNFKENNWIIFVEFLNVYKDITIMTIVMKFFFCIQYQL